ncbi:hypothetical protein Ancab_013883 [Ancistrocladus abbreviatus]
MGCSASRPDSLHSKTTEEPSSISHSPARSNLPTVRSLSAPLVHHLPLRKGDTHHLVSLTSTTYGSLMLVDYRHPSTSANSTSNFDGRDSSEQSQNPSQTGELKKDPSSPDSVINTWELMEGLDDDFNFDSGKKLSDSFVFVEKPQEIEEEIDPDSNFNVKPLWKHLSEESLLAKMDPNVASSYSRALSSRRLGYNRLPINRSVGCSPLISPLSSSMDSSPCISTSSNNSSKTQTQLPGSDDKIVLYFTSLRGIRRTYEDCCEVRMIFRGFRVLVDERDISMDSTYRKELQAALGGKAMILPQVFIRGKHIGGAEEIRQLHEVGELAIRLEGFPVQNAGFVCESCGDARFVPCPNCNGSRKVFQEEEGRIQRCPDCNENGLIRCPACCY